MTDDKKPGLLITMLLGKKKPVVGKPSDTPPAEEKPEAETESGYEEGLKAAAEEMLAAIKSGDAEKLATALKAAVTCCGEEE